MSFRDVLAMIECVFYVNDLPGGEGQHDGGMKGKDAATVLANPMLQSTAEEGARLDSCAQGPQHRRHPGAATEGTPNLTLTHERKPESPCRPPTKSVTPRGVGGGLRRGGEEVFPAVVLLRVVRSEPVDEDGETATVVPTGTRFEMSIEEQAASLMTDGLSFAGRDPQINVFATFAAFLEGIAREGFEMWRDQCNLTGPNEGLNVMMHLSHVGASTGRDHFSGWSLDWINLARVPAVSASFLRASGRAGRVLAVRDAARHGRTHRGDSERQPR